MDSKTVKVILWDKVKRLPGTSGEYIGWVADGSSVVTCHGMPVASVPWIYIYIYYTVSNHSLMKILERYMHAFTEKFNLLANK